MKKKQLKVKVFRSTEIAKLQTTEQMVIINI